MTDQRDLDLDTQLDIQRRRLLRGATAATAAALVAPGIMAWDAPATVSLPFANGDRALSNAYEGKGSMIVQRTRPPVLETPFNVYNKGLITPNSQHYVRWHLSRIPHIDANAYRLAVRGHVYCSLSLSMDELVTSYRSHEVVAVSQCAGNSRAFFEPRVPGSQWGHGAMANAAWRGVRLGDVLRRAGIRPGSVCVRFHGLDEAVMPATPAYRKSLPVDHAFHDDILLAYEVNGDPLPYLHGFPLRLVVPGWYSTYWVKMLGDIEVLAEPDDSYWMTRAYRVDSTPVTRMAPRSFVTSLRQGTMVQAHKPLEVTGIAFGGDCDVAAVHWRTGPGEAWQPARITGTTGRYGFSRRSAIVRPEAGQRAFQVRARNCKGDVQPEAPVWNAPGYGYNAIETVTYEALA